MTPSGESDTLERRKALVRLVFDHYAAETGQVEMREPTEMWAEVMIDRLAGTGPIVDLDRIIFEGIGILLYQAKATLGARDQ